LPPLISVQEAQAHSSRGPRDDDDDDAGAGAAAASAAAMGAATAADAGDRTVAAGAAAVGVGLPAAPALDGLTTPLARRDASARSITLAMSRPAKMGTSSAATFVRGWPSAHSRASSRSNVLHMGARSERCAAEIAGGSHASGGHQRRLLGTHAFRSTLQINSTVAGRQQVTSWRLAVLKMACAGPRSIGWRHACFHSRVRHSGAPVPRR